MNIFEIISAIALIIACVFIVLVVLMQETKTNMSQAISGGSGDNFYQKNSGRTKEAKLNRIAVVCTVIFFVLALAVNIINTHASSDSEVKEDTSSSIVLDGDSSTESTGSSVAESTSSDASGAESTMSEASATESTTAPTESEATSAESSSSVAESTVSE